ncbi:MAG: DUF1553 domain-containing protein [Bacteroidetes bacterium]|nr:DUF1553 domain-containing protein [Bacteroidota bacterium]
MKQRILFSIGTLLLLLPAARWAMDGLTAKIDYNRQVKPILNKNCMGCHGGVKKAGNVSFLFEEEMLKPGKSGRVPVVRGDAHASEMIRRILSDDSDERMPKNAAPLAEEDIATLRQWIDDGAAWETHWAYQSLQEPAVPSERTVWNLFGLLTTTEGGWPQTEIDHFVLQKMREKGLSPAPAADRATLIRRVSLDLTGLPPTLAEVEAFEKDASPNAYEKVVDRLLQSPAYGERWTAFWMDLARYADTKGYESDGGRTMWRYRDYVIRAFNDDKPFNRFTVEQLAGDLLPKGSDGFPLESNLVATGFHRNTMTNNEGGTDDEEFRTAALIDRVNTTWEVWQGTTFGCIQCHSHPYDPIPHQDYYRYLAFFNNTRDEDVWDDWPKLRYYQGEDSVRVERLKEWVRTYNPAQVPFFTQFLRVMEPKINAHNFIRGDQSTALLISHYGIKDKGNARIAAVDLTGVGSVVMQVITRAERAVLTLRRDQPDGPILATLPIPTRDTVLVAPITGAPGKHDIFLSLSSPKNPAEWVRITYAAFQPVLPGASQPGYADRLADYASLLTRPTDGLPVLWEGTGDFARKTHIFERGNWLVKGAEVQPGVPALFPPLPSNAPRNRLGMAQWLVSRDNPLTARVIVNRFWEQLFGRGIVETVEDFGSQGSEPTHRELLDWLAVRFMEEDQWRVKKLLKRLVMSATYRQTTVSDPQKQRQDPYNYWLARGPRVRLSAEQIRDQALAAAGLLSPNMYGPSMMPPQPDGIWQSPYNSEKWVTSEGENRYRRSIYTYWKRTAPYPSLITFDAPSREFCQSRRLVTNTPLQALVTLNDPVYLEAAQQLAASMHSRATTPARQLAEGYRRLTLRPIPDQHLSTLLKVYQNALTTYRRHPAQADSLLRYGPAKTPERAALLVAANVLLNMDSVLTKE